MFGKDVRPLLKSSELVKLHLHKRLSEKSTSRSLFYARVLACVVLVSAAVVASEISLRLICAHRSGKLEQ